MKGGRGEEDGVYSTVTHKVIVGIQNCPNSLYVLCLP